MSIACRQIENMREYGVSMTATGIETAPGSANTSTLLRMMNHMSDDDLTDRLEPLIYLMWGKFQRIVTAYCVVYWLKACLTYVYLGYHNSHPALASLIMLFDLGQLFFEAKCLYSQRRDSRYFTDVWNYVDLLINVSSIVIVSLTIADAQNEDLVWILLRMALLAAVWIRSMTWLRVNKNTRYLITMVLSVFKDMVAFLIILGVSILGFAFEWRMTYSFATSDGVLVTGEIPNFYDSLYETIMLVYGNGPDAEANGEKYNYGRFVAINVMNIMLSLTLLNLLIAVVSQTYTEVEESKAVHDLRGLLHMMNDFSAFMEGLVPRKHHRRSYHFSLIKIDDSVQGLVRSLLSGIVARVERR